MSKTVTSDVNVLQHPLVDCLLSVLRDEKTPGSQFRHSVRMLSILLAYQATASLKTKTIEVQTPIEKCDGHCIGKRIGLVPILRAGIAMVEPMLDLIPDSEIWHLGMYRDEETAQPVPYYSKLPANKPVDVAFVLDPMLATGGSAVMAINAIEKWGVSEIKMLSVIAAPEGIEHIRSECPEVELHTCVVDERLNENNYIVPGLGDAGDRIFNTHG